MIKTIETFDFKTLKALYEKVGWTVYLKDNQAFERMFENSLTVLGAYDDNRLVGVVRAIGDTAHILYIQDIIVDPAYQRKGMGRALLAAITEKHADIRQKVLITDLSDDKAVAFYGACGFKRADASKIACFVRFD